MKKVILALMMLAPLSAWAAGTPVGTVITNQASATYKDAGGLAFSSTSNTLLITVQQVYSVTLAPASGTIDQMGAPGALVYYTRTLTNTGNGSDSFNLNAVSSNLGWAAPRIFLDVNNNGTYESGTDTLVAGPLAFTADQVRRLFIEIQIPGGAINGDTNDSTLTATSVGNASATSNVTDRTTVTTGPAITETLASTRLLDPDASGTNTPGDTLRLTATATNNGSAPARQVVLVEPVPAHTTYVAGSAFHTGGAGTAVIEWFSGGAWQAVEPAPAGVSAVRVTLSGGAGNADLANGAAATLRFDVQVLASAPMGTPGLTQTGTTDYQTTAGAAQPQANASAFVTIAQVAGVALSTAAPKSVPAGSPASYAYTVTNTGNGAEFINIQVGTSLFGYTAQVLGPGGVPLIDNNGDGKIDVGMLAAGASYNFTVVITPPQTAPNNQVENSIVQAVSSFNPGVLVNTSVQTTVIRIDGVTLSPGSATSPVTPGGTAAFGLTLRNTGNSPDSFNLAGTPSQVGYTVHFVEDLNGNSVVDAGEPTITQSPMMAANATLRLIAVVTSPAGAPANQIDVNTITATSVYGPTPAVATSLLDTVVNATRSFNLTVNGSANLSALSPGTAVYALDLGNTGNVADAYTFSVNTSTQGWSFTYYQDNGNGMFDGADALITTSGTVNPGTSVRIWAKVTVPGGVPSGTQDVANIRATSTGAPALFNAVNLTTSVGAPNITLNKSYTVVGGGQPVPGAIIEYRVDYQNTAPVNAFNVVITDIVPAFTLYVTGTLQVNGVTMTDAADADLAKYNSPSSVQWDLGNVIAGGSGYVTFRVQIQ